MAQLQDTTALPRGGIQTQIAGKECDLFFRLDVDKMPLAQRAGIISEVCERVLRAAYRSDDFASIFAWRVEELTAQVLRGEKHLRSFTSDLSTRLWVGLDDTGIEFRLFNNWARTGEEYEELPGDLRERHDDAVRELRAYLVESGQPHRESTSYPFESLPAVPISRPESAVSPGMLSSLLESSFLNIELEPSVALDASGHLEASFRKTFWDRGKLLPELTWTDHSFLSSSADGICLFDTLVAQDRNGDGRIDWIEDSPETLNLLARKLDALASCTTDEVVLGIRATVASAARELLENKVDRVVTCGGSGGLIALLLQETYHQVYPNEQAPQIFHVSQANNNRLYHKGSSRGPAPADPETVLAILADALPRATLWSRLGFGSRGQFVLLDDHKSSGVKREIMGDAFVNAGLGVSFWTLVSGHKPRSSKDVTFSTSDAFLQAMRLVATQFSKDISNNPLLSTASFTHGGVSLVQPNLAPGSKAFLERVLVSIHSDNAERR